ncbi:RNA polymerase sigma factor [Chryseobacterium populi]|uniref:RNA polymerase sigma factor, sigma-70 family n=1 Tax=Chryseobacterium populi TaxID=1144316 RepID=J2K2K2_9FLAO|nr:sigma-70 family RNA polymerase sigma factor [Chryseobacterium populi]EJL74385.1 RNA polymerase sigma factor, sigma-70 family [Chryseobacterium populi]
MDSAYTTYGDEQLLALWKSGDATAFECFFKANFLRLAETAFRKTGDWHLSEELAQDALYLLYKNSEKIESRPIAYCHEILKNKIIDLYRKRKLHTTPQTEKDAILVETNPYKGSIEYKELEAQVRYHVGTLPEQCRQVFLLRREAGLTNRETALKLGLSEKTVENHMTRALTILRKKLDYYLCWGLMVVELFQ